MKSVRRKLAVKLGGALAVALICVVAAWADEAWPDHIGIRPGDVVCRDDGDYCFPPSCQPNSDNALCDGYQYNVCERVQQRYVGDCQAPSPGQTAIMKCYDKVYCARVQYYHGTVTDPDGSGPHCRTAVNCFHWIRKVPGCAPPPMHAVPGPGDFGGGPF